MAKLKVYRVIRTETSVSEKFILAKSKEDAEAIADENAWQEKEEVQDSKLFADLAKPEDFKGRYIETKGGDYFHSNELNLQK